MELNHVFGQTEAPSWENATGIVISDGCIAIWVDESIKVFPLSQIKNVQIWDESVPKSDKENDPHE